MTGKKHWEMVKARPEWAERGLDEGQGHQRGKRDLDGFWANKMGISAGCSPAQMICSVLVVMGALTARCASLCQGTGST